MKDKKGNIQNWLNTGTKKESFFKEMFVVVITMYIIYQLGYGIGTFLAHIGL